MRSFAGERSKKHMTGRKLSEETCKRMSESHLKRYKMRKYYE